MLVGELASVAEGSTVQDITESVANGKDKHRRGGRRRVKVEPVSVVEFLRYVDTEVRSACTPNSPFGVSVL
jgi:hypothetical protein